MGGGANIRIISIRGCSAAGSGLTRLANLDLLSMVRGGTPQFMYLWMP